MFFFRFGYIRLTGDDGFPDFYDVVTWLIRWLAVTGEHEEEGHEEAEEATFCYLLLLLLLLLLLAIGPHIDVVFTS